MRYALVRAMDVNNGPGICASLFVQGCNHHCKDCFNPDTWDFEGGYVWDGRIEFKFIEACKNEHVKNVCILGGEPLDQGNDLLKLLTRIKKEVRKPIWLWTGYTWEEIFENPYTVKQQNFDHKRIIQKEILKSCDIVVDGPFISELKDNYLKHKGSHNQRIIDVKKTIELNRVVLYGEA